MTEPLSLSLTEWIVLGVIGERPAHGFAVATLTTDEGELGRIWRIPRSAIYRALGRVEAAGLVTADVVEPGRGPQRTIYAITLQGREALDTWLRTPVRHVRDVRSHLLMKLALLDRAGRDPSDLLVRQRAILQPIAEAVKAERSEGEGFDATLLAWRRATASAALSFLDDITPADTRALAGPQPVTPRPPVTARRPAPRSASSTTSRPPTRGHQLDRNWSRRRSRLGRRRSGWMASWPLLMTRCAGRGGPSGGSRWRPCAARSSVTGSYGPAAAPRRPASRSCSTRRSRSSPVSSQGRRADLGSPKLRPVWGPSHLRHPGGPLSHYDY
jgi:DNA-binding PadR family transcriptional regulator